MSISMTIWKYPFAIDDEFDLSLPFGARILMVEVQGGGPCLWALVDAENAEEVRRFSIVGTGHPAPARGYIDTFQQPPFVWHLFEIAPND